MPFSDVVGAMHHRRGVDDLGGPGDCGHGGGRGRRRRPLRPAACCQNARCGGIGSRRAPRWATLPRRQSTRSGRQQRQPRPSTPTWWCPTRARWPSAAAGGGRRGQGEVILTGLTLKYEDDLTAVGAVPDAGMRLVPLPLLLQGSPAAGARSEGGVHCRCTVTGGVQRNVVRGALTPSALRPEEQQHGRSQCCCRTGDLDASHWCIARCVQMTDRQKRRTSGRSSLTR